MSKMSRRLKLLLIILLISPVIVLKGYSLYLTLQGNFHTITPGEAYRSAQLDRRKLEFYINKYNIKSVISLSCERKEARWYKDELEICKEYRIVRHSIPMSSRHEPTEQVIKYVTDAFNGSPRPVLIHCKRGSDRTGLVAAMWKVLVDKEPKSVAKKQLSLVYLHFPIGWAGSLDRYFEKWKPPQDPR